MNHCNICNGLTYLISRSRGSRTYKCARCGKLTAHYIDALEPDIPKPVPVTVSSSHGLDQIADLISDEKLTLGDVDSAVRSDVEQILVSRLSRDKLL